MAKAEKSHSFQGDYPKVLCVCSAGLLRSATASFVFSNPPFNFNVRCCGTEEYALIPVTRELLLWADYAIVCAETHHAHKIEKMLENIEIERDIYSLNISDDYDYRDPDLIKLIEATGRKLFIDTTRIL
jgi:predicted protein tyrosine phosphatase